MRRNYQQQRQEKNYECKEDQRVEDQMLVNKSS